MTEIVRSKLVKSGKWRTLESGWNVTFACRFRDPAGARVKVRYGDGWPFGKDRQKQTLNGSDRLLRVSGASVLYARIQMNVQQDTQVTYTYIPA